MIGGVQVLKAVIFDMDGVLVDSERFYMSRRIGFLKEKGMPVQDPALFVGADGKRVWELMAPQATGRELEELKQEYETYRLKHPVRYDALANPQVVPLFKELRCRGLAIGIASSSPRDMVELMLRQVKLDSLVDVYVSGTDCTARKPDPEVYCQAMERLGVVPEEAIAVEDSTVGILAAHRAGLRVYALEPYLPQDQSLAVMVLAELQELTQYLPE